MNAGISYHYIVFKLARLHTCLKIKNTYLLFNLTNPILLCFWKLNITYSNRQITDREKLFCNVPGGPKVITIKTYIFFKHPVYYLCSFAFSFGIDWWKQQDPIVTLRRRQLPKLKASSNKNLTKRESDLYGAILDSPTQTAWCDDLLIYKKCLLCFKFHCTPLAFTKYPVLFALVG